MTLKSTVCSDTRQYHNYEGFDFPVSGPYQEFPIKTNGVYTGGEFFSLIRFRYEAYANAVEGSPGADRVVFNTNGEYAGAITRKQPEVWKVQRARLNYLAHLLRCLRPMLTSTLHF